MGFLGDDMNSGFLGFGLVGYNQQTNQLSHCLIALLLLTLCACGSGGGSEDSDQPQTNGDGVVSDSQIAAGAGVYENWVAITNGGTGTLPADEPVSAYVKCVSCHGWDLLGESGGAVRWSRGALQPNAGFGDSNMISRSVSTGDFGHLSAVTEEQVLGIAGRSWSQGSAIWDGSDTNASLGNTHPNYRQSESLSSQQLTNLLAFLNASAAQPDEVFEHIDSTQDPVQYSLRSDASAARGETYYNKVCSICHGDPNADSTALSDFLPGPGGLLAFLSEDGAPSQFMHRVRWGKPGTAMTRFAIGSPTALDVADLMKYLNSLSSPSDNSVFFANAGSNQTVAINSTVVLDSSGSIVIDSGSLSVFWQLDEKPAASIASLSESRSETTTILVDQIGDYRISLTLDNGVSSDSDSITISVFNNEMVARGQALWDIAYDCDSCHGRSLDLEPIPVPGSIRAGFTQRFGDMSDLGNLSEAEMSDLRAYLATIQ